jgi:hypothetical protein
MTDEIQEVETPVIETKESPAPPATQSEHLIPKSRFDEVNQARDKAEKELKKLQYAETKRMEAQLTKEQLLEKQNAEYKAKAESAQAEAKALTAKLIADADEKLLKAAFLLKAKDMGFDNPADAYALANKSVAKKEDGDYDEAAIEGALKPLIGRLPIKAQGDGKGTPKLPPAQKPKTKEGRAFNRPF